MRDRILDYFAAFLNAISRYQKEAIQLGCFTLGVFFAFCFPKAARRVRSALAVCSMVMILPAACRLLMGICRDAKRLHA